jgi:uncharacterized DUF497 family protein
MRFEWDAAKNEANRIKHQIDFETAKFVFDDPHCVTFVERVTDGEDRWHAIGSLGDVMVVVVLHAYRIDDAEETIRIISARRATRRERGLYVQAIG